MTACHIARFGDETGFTSALKTLLPNHTDGLSPEAEDVLNPYPADDQ
jgi:hypothetical protein